MIPRPAQHSRVRRWAGVAAGAALFLAAHGAEAADPATPARGDVAPAEAPRAEAHVRVSGLWYFQNRDMRELLTVLEPEGKPLPVLDAAFIEDAILVLQSALADRGYLKPTGTVRLTLVDGSQRTEPWAAGSLPALPRTLAATEADFHLEPGVLYFIDRLDIEGLRSITPEQAQGYFVGQGFVLGGKSARRYTPEGVDRGCESLRVELRRNGRMDAEVTVADRTIDDASGAVALTVRVEEGPLHRIGTVRVEGAIPEEARAQVERHVQSAIGAVYTPLRRQDLLQIMHVVLYEHGYAEATVRLSEDDTTTSEGGEILHTIKLEFDAGSLIRVGEVRFTGDDKTRLSVLRRATKVRSGQIFDRNRIEADRLKLSSLGAFAAVRADVTPREQTPDVWDLAYQLRPSKRLEVGVLGGYGSYERFRGGIEVFHGDQLGRAERGRLQLIVSTKSTSAEYQLTVPQIFGTTADANLRAFGLDREEVSFDRKEAGVSGGVRKHSDRFGVDMAARYQFESLRAENVASDLQGTAPENSRVGAVTFGITQDRRDNPLTPKSGHDFSLAFETAAQVIGGDVNYQRLDAKVSWHTPLTRELTLHLGLSHGVIWSLGDPVEDIPINKRFFPGGESSVRGYAEGTAAPRGTDGEIIGAEISTVANVELELALLKSFSAVAFVDTGLTGASVDSYPGDQLRVSAGLGLRYNSLIGPVRLEYGYNIVRETGDQRGQLHLSLGFPF